MQKNSCQYCHTENEPEYRFCKNCGAPIAPPGRHSSRFGQTQAVYPVRARWRAFERYESVAGISVEGIPMDDIARYTWDNIEKICPKIAKLELTGTKASWCWPAALLGLFLGPLGAAIWFLYRRVYKAAAVLIVIGLVLLGIQTALDFQIISRNYDVLFNLLASGNGVDYKELVDFLVSGNFAKQSAASQALSEISGLITAAVAGIYAIYWYKEHMLDMLKRYRSSGVDMRYYKSGLRMLGEPSPGTAFLGVALLVSAHVLANMLPLFFK